MSSDSKGLEGFYPFQRPVQMIKRGAKMETFKEWLLKKEKDNSNIGDLARNVAGHNLFPNGYSKKKCGDFLEAMAEPDNVMQAFYGAWKTYIFEFDRKRTKEKSVSTQLSVDDKERLDQYTKENGFKSRSAAIEFLIQVGLANDGK